MSTDCPDRRAVYERALARANKALYEAQAAASDMNRESELDDLVMLQLEVARMWNASMTGRRWRSSRPHVSL